MPKGVYKRDVVKMPQKLAAKAVDKISDLISKNSQLNGHVGSLTGQVNILKQDLQETTQEVIALQDEIKDKKERDLDGLVTVTIGITRAGRSIQDAEFKVQTNEENFSLVVGKGGLVQTVITKF